MCLRRDPSNLGPTSTKGHPAHNMKQALRDLLDLEHIEVNIFREFTPDEGWQRVYGGQVLGQAARRPSP